MTTFNRATVTIVTALALSVAPASSVPAQVGKGLIDPNVATESELRELPHMTPAIVKSIMEKRPFMSVLAADLFLLDQKLTREQATEFYRKAFVHVNLNTGTREEFALIPGAGVRMSREFAEYRPWKSWAQFDKEIGKYVGQQETDRFKQYMFIPINLNTASDGDLLTIPGAGPRMVREFKDYRPWKTKEQFDKEIGKYVGPKETARFWRYVVIQ
jgi:DNA uptake protein ComE-like DNA-binding protein